MKCWRVSSDLLCSVPVRFLDDRWSLVCFQPESLSPHQSSNSTNVGVTLVLSLHTQTISSSGGSLEKAKRPECPSCWYPVWADGSKLVWLQQTWSQIALQEDTWEGARQAWISFLSTHVSLYLHVTNNTHHSACWQVMTQETSVHSFLEHRDYYQIFLLTR